MNERRTESRYLCADIVRVNWFEPGKGERQSTQAVLEDISSRGICVQLEHAIPVGCEVHTLLGDHEFEGRVCYCSYQEIGYFIGVNFDDQDRWNKHMYQPRHLTDLQELAMRTQ